MRMSKFLASLLAITLVGSSLNWLQEYSTDTVIIASAADYDEVTEGDFIFRVYSDQAELYEFTATTVKEVNIPSEIGGKPVTVIGNNAFSGNSALTSVTIPDSVKTIGSEAFFNCSNLTEATIGNGVTTIDIEAFCSCKNLVDVTLGKNVAEIRRGAFSNCSSLTEIILPDSVKVLGTYAFGACSSLVAITLSNNLNVLESDTFYDCKSLRNITLPNNLQKISNNAFRLCSSLKKVVIPDSVVEIGDCAFYDCSNLASAEIGNGLTTVSEYTFGYCDKLADVSIGDNVIEIKEGAFSNCSSLTEVKLPDKLEVLGSLVFLRCSSLTKVTMGDEIATLNSDVFNGCSALKDIKLSSKLKTISSSAFKGCKHLDAITIPEKVSVIGECAFYSTGLKSVSLPVSVKTIGENCFNDCESLAELIVWNPNMVFKEDLGMSKNVTIMGYDESLAQEYAEKYGNPFVLLEKTTSTSTTTTTKVPETTTTTTPAATTTKAPETTTTTTPAATTTKAPETTTTTTPAATTTKAPETTTTTPAATTTKAPEITTTTTPAATTTKAPETTTTTKAAAMTTKATTTTEPTTTIKASPTNEELFNNADVNDDGKVDAIDATTILSYSVGKGEPKGTKGDVNGDGMVDFSDAVYVLHYYTMVSSATDVTDYFVDLAKLPAFNGSNVTISQAETTINDKAEYGVFKLEYTSDLKIYGVSGQILFNGKTYKEAGFSKIEISLESDPNAPYINPENGKFYAVTKGKNSSDKLIFYVYGGKAGKYTISYDDLKFVDNNYVKFTGYTKKDFNPTFTIGTIEVTTNSSTTTAPVTTTSSTVQSTTSTSTNTTTALIMTTTSTPTEITEDILRERADVDDSGDIDSVDAAKVLSYSLDERIEFKKGKGDVNNDGVIDFRDVSIIQEYFARFTTGSLTDDFFLSHTKLPKKIEKNVTISQRVTSGFEIDEYSTFELEFSSDEAVCAVTGQLLFNGKSCAEVGIDEVDIDILDRKTSSWLNTSNGKFYAYRPGSSLNSGKIIFYCYGIKPGEYAISYENLKFYGADCAEYKGYTKTEFNPYLTVSETKSITKKTLGDIDGNGFIDAVDASKISVVYARLSTGGTATEEEKIVCDVNRDGLIDAVDASKVLAYYAYVSTGKNGTFGDFLLS
ncbi:leucine-rich repeat protein [Ruminococcus sp.]|uniref:leucine-rich repeat protein n=1 Tax=Ruminococcus sp. TaxID=41978 RepID=UPI0025D22568|nr:leucine-rich repeat protein [Ruminococcus sp.]